LLSKQDEPISRATTSQKPLIFHLRHHPRGISRQQVRTAYTKTIGPLMQAHTLISKLAHSLHHGNI
jgi:hypothetical protein